MVETLEVDLRRYQKLFSFITNIKNVFFLFLPPPFSQPKKYFLSNCLNDGSETRFMLNNINLLKFDFVTV